MCSPDMNLSVICESTRHLFIYKNSYSTASGLRKRSGPQLQIGQQRVISLEGANGEILGVNVENDVVMLLTENSILCLQLAEEE
jgi:predicted regulator of Ras-like GTPase activity (Roadblock/LC7/MglB family)